MKTNTHKMTPIAPNKITCSLTAKYKNVISWAPVVFSVGKNPCLHKENDQVYMGIH